MTSPGLTPDQSNAYTMLQDLLRSWGLESLSNDALNLVTQGYSQSQIPLLLQDTDAYKQRFSGNEARRKAGLPVLSPSEYLATEDAYRQVMSQAGVPGGFYDSPTDFADLIGRDIAPTELQRRVDYYSTTLQQMSGYDMDFLRHLYPDYNIQTPQDFLPYLLDPTKGMDVINSNLRGAVVGGAAAGRGVNISDELARRLGSAADTNQVFNQANVFANNAATGSFLSDIYGGNYNAERAGQETFFGDTAAEQERKRLQALEVGNFSGGGGITKTSLGQSPGNI